MIARFRAWDGTMRYSEWYGLPQFFEMCYEDILMQSTGFMDKKRTKEYRAGQEIYEGDIVIEEGVLCEVKFSPKDGVIAAYPINESNFICAWSWQEMEVIGNKHENPELLENNMNDIKPPVNKPNN